jgi:O-antigen/teichoic acid export membrane protein
MIRNIFVSFGYIVLWAFFTGISDNGLIGIVGAVAVWALMNLSKGFKDGFAKAKLEAKENATK